MTSPETPQSDWTLVEEAHQYREHGGRMAGPGGWPDCSTCAVLARLRAREQELEAALRELLSVAERIRGGDPKLDSEEWYAARDYARHTLAALFSDEGK